MPHTLELFFEPPIRARALFEHFAGRPNYTIGDGNIDYTNPDTLVELFFEYRASRNLLGRMTVAEMTFDVNYCRASYVALEAEVELAAFMAAFKPRIHDPQIDGMGDGPYSAEGFLRGWRFGNLFGIRNILARDPAPEIATLPAATLQADWHWNHQREARGERLSNRRFVPKITHFLLDGRPVRLAAWGAGMPISLPHVDYVAVGRPIKGEYRHGLAPWSEVAEVVARAGFDPARDPLDLEYFVTPPPIEAWVARYPLYTGKLLDQLGPHTLMDAELIAAARA